MKYITVLDFEIGRVYQYDISKEDWADNESCEAYLANKGHRLKDCDWMLHENPQIVID